MISHALTRRALRTKLLTLEVATTGSTTLAAVASGYTRTTGSFITDGFYPGMELLPAGFTDNDVDTIEAVTALTITVASTHTADVAASGRTLSVPPPASRAWENKKFKPVVGTPWLEEQYLPGGPGRKITFGSANGELEYFPIYTPRVYVPENLGAEAADAYADSLLTLFAPSTAITIASASCWVRGDLTPSSGQLLRTEGGFAVVPVTIPLRLRTANSI